VGGVRLEGRDGVLEGGNLVRGQGLLFVMVGLKRGDLVGRHSDHGRAHFVVGLKFIDARLWHINQSPPQAWF